MSNAVLASHRFRVAFPLAMALVAALVFQARPSEVAGDSTYEVPAISRVQSTLPDNLVTAVETHLYCLNRADVTGTTVNMRAVCHRSAKPEPPPAPPFAPMPAFHQLVEDGAFVPSTGAILFPVLDCTEVFTGFAISIAIGIQLDKAGGPASGSNVFTTDTTAPYDCQPGLGTTTSTAPLTLTPLAADHNEDSAESLAVLGLADPCTDYQELDDTANAGGLRDPFNPYDFYDTDGDGSVTADDVGAVAARFLVSEGQPGYEPKYDRGANLGPNPWNVDGPDGSITIDDISAAAAQFLHAC